MKNGNYELVVAPPNYPGKLYRGRYCSKHVLVYWETYGIIPAEDEIIHHKDGNRFNNSPDNLELMKRSDHTRFHDVERTRKLVEMQCPWCRKHFIKQKNLTFLQRGGYYTCCSKLCANKMNTLSKQDVARRIVGNVIREFSDISSKYDL